MFYWIAKCTGNPEVRLITLSYNARTRGLLVLIIQRYIRRQKEITLCMCWDWPWKLELSAACCEEILNQWCFPNCHCAGWTFWGRCLHQAWIIIIFYLTPPIMFAHISVWSLTVQLHALLFNWHLWSMGFSGRGVGGERGQCTVVLHPLQHWHWQCPQPCLMSSAQRGERSNCSA